MPGPGRHTDAYRHEALPDASTHIRLLELDDTDTWDEQGIRCRLTSWHLEGAPAYHAISYTWGDPSVIDHVSIEDKSLGIAQNCADVLHQLAYSKTSRYYWMDCMCIDQGNVEERNHQVAFMGTIYGLAQHVLVCLGCSDDMAEDAMHVVAEIGARCSVTTNPLAQYPFPEPWQSGESAELRAIDEHLVTQLTAFFDVLGSRLEGLLRGLATLSRMSYFRRLWVVQELLSATSASICYGKVRVPVASLEYVLRLAFWISFFLGMYGNHLMGAFVRLRPWLENFAPYLFDNDDYEVNEGALTLLRNYVLRQSQASSVKDFRPLNPQTAILFAGGRDCADKRDTVFGMLAVIDWGESIPLKPSYDKSVFQLALDYSQTCGVMPTYVADTLISNLGIGPSDVDVQRAIAARHLWPLAGRRTLTVSPTTNVILYGRGLRISKDTCRELSPGRYTLTTGKTTWSFVAPDAQWQDWIVFAPHYDFQAFIVRQQCNDTHFVGSAYSSGGTSPDYSGEPSIIRFDAEDFFVWTLLQQQVPKTAVEDLDLKDEATRNFLEMPFQRRPICSFLTMP